MKLTASIVTYRTPQDELLGCLSLLEEEKVERIYVIDNSPTDEIRSLVQEFRTVEYIHRPDNPGYGAAAEPGCGISSCA